MHEALLIARREYRERVRSKAFIFMTIAFPALLSLSFGGSFLAAKLGSGAKHVVIASNDAGFAQAVFTEVSKGKKSDDTIEVVAPATEADRNKLTAQVGDKSLDGYLWIGDPRERRYPGRDLYLAILCGPLHERNSAGRDEPGAYPTAAGQARREPGGDRWVAQERRREEHPAQRGQAGEVEFAEELPRRVHHGPSCSISPWSFTG